MGAHAPPLSSFSRKKVVLLLHVESNFEERDLPNETAEERESPTPLGEDRSAAPSAPRGRRRGQPPGPCGEGGAPVDQQREPHRGSQRSPRELGQAGRRHRPDCGAPGGDDAGTPQDRLHHAGRPRHHREGLQQRTPGRLPTRTSPGRPWGWARVVFPTLTGEGLERD